MSDLETKTMDNTKPRNSEAEKAASCDIHGDYVSRNLTADDPLRIDIWSRCPECEAETKRQLEWDKLQQERKRKHRLFELSGIPPRFKEKTLHDFEAETSEQQSALDIVTEYSRKWKEVLAKGTCLAFCGRPGTGKTHLAAGIAQDVIYHHGDSVRYTTVRQCIADIRATWRDRSKDEQEVLDEFIRCKLLILDEVGVQLGSEAERTQLFDILDGRYQRQLPTIVISNHPYDELHKFLGERAVDRLQEGGGGLVSFTWESYRDRAEVVPNPDRKERRKEEHWERGVVI